MKQKSAMEKKLDLITILVAAVMCVYHMAAANFAIFTSEQHINLHIAFSLAIIFLQGIKLGDKSAKSRISSVFMIILLIVSIVTAAYGDSAQMTRLLDIRMEEESNRLDGIPGVPPQEFTFFDDIASNPAIRKAYEIMQN